MMGGLVPWLKLFFRISASLVIKEGEKRYSKTKISNKKYPTKKQQSNKEQTNNKCGHLEREKKKILELLHSNRDYRGKK